MPRTRKARNGAQSAPLQLTCDGAGSLSVKYLVAEAILAYLDEYGSIPRRPYSHNAFRAVYSDHQPILFKFAVGATNDD